MSSSSVPGTNVPPVSFPGIASGIDYNSIIDKLTSLTLAPNVQLNAQIATLNAANTELVKINNLFACVQNTLGALSDPNLFASYDATSSNSTFATASGIPGTPAVAGTYTIESSTVATATSVASNTAAGHNIDDTITSGTYAGHASNTVPLADSFAAITPSNGSGSAGSITVDGVTVSYNVNVDSLQAVLARIQTAVDANYDASFTIQDVGGTIQLSGSKPITLGSANDQGNLLQVLKLDQAQVDDSGPGPYTVTGTSGVGGLNQAAALNSTTAAGFVTPVTSGTFTINGVSISVSASGDNLASILAKINASAAGVTASYNSATNQITLTSNQTGAQSIVVGRAGDTSNFLTAAGLTTASGATSTIGQQAVLKLQNSDGSTSTYYSNSNTITSAIPGVSLNLLSASTSPYTISVAQNTSSLVNAVNTFVSAYNAVVTEINTATAAPTIVPAPPGTGGVNTSQAVGGGVLWGNTSVQTLQGQLTSLVSGFFGSGSSYNSLASIGLSLSDSFSVLTTSDNGTTDTGGTASGTGAVQTTTYQGTDGTFQALDTTKFLNALQANPSAVQAIFQGSNSVTNNVGSFLTSVTGLPTLLNSGTVGTIPNTAILQGFENSNNDEITSIQASIQQITDNANMQADQLRAEFVSSETQIAEYQSLQSQLSGFFKSSGS